MSDRTLVLLKPDAVERGLAGQILSRFETKGLKVSITYAQDALATDPVTPDDVAATIFHQLGVDPYTELQSPTGRPMQLFREGKVIDKLLG